MALDSRFNSSGPGEQEAQSNNWFAGDRTLSQPSNMTTDQSLFNPRHTNSEESALVANINATARLYPESEEYGTPAVRTSIWMRSTLPPTNSRWKYRIPLSVKIAGKLQRYMGASDGQWVSGAAPDVSPNNTLDGIRDINYSQVPDFLEDATWENGGNDVRYKDRNSLFWPAYQTIYPDDTSVLNSVIVSKACATLEVIADAVWSEMVGNGMLTNEQFLERSDELIAEKSRGLFDSRFQIVPKTRYTEADEQRGYSWSTDIELYANSMKMVGSYTVVSRRLSDFLETAA